MKLAHWLTLVGCACALNASCSTSSPPARVPQSLARSAAQQAPASPAAAGSTSAPGSLEERRARLAERERQAQSSGDAEACARVALDWLEFAIDSDDWGQARQRLRPALDLASALSSDEDRMRLERLACSVCEELALPDDRREHARRWVELASARPLPRTRATAAQQAQARIELAAALSDEAARERERLEALSLAGECGDPELQAAVKIGSARILAQDGHAAEALGELEAAQSLSREPGTRARIEGWRGNVLLDLGREDEAHQCYAESERLARRHGISLRGFEAQYLHAQALQRMGESRPLEALPLLTRALELHETRGNLADVAETLVSLGSAYEQAIALGQCTEAERAGFRTRQRELFGRLESPAIGAPLHRRVEGLIGLAISFEDEDLARAAATLGRAEQLLEDSPLAQPRARLLSARAWLSFLQARNGASPGAADLRIDAQRCALRSARLFLACGDIDNAFAVRDTAFRALLELDRLEEAEPLLAAAEDELGLHVGRVDTGRFSSLPFASLGYFEGHRQDWTARMLARKQLSAADRELIVQTGFEVAGRWKGRQLLARILAKDARREQEIRRIDLQHGAQRAGAEALELPLSAELSSAAVEEASARAERHVAQGIWDAVRSQGSLLSIRAALQGPNTALLVFAAGSADVRVPECPSELYAYVLTARGLHFVDLGAWHELQPKIQRYVEGLACQGSARLELPELVNHGHELYKALVDKPLAALPPDERAGMNRLVVVPERGMEALPFDALVVEPVLAAKDEKGQPRRVGFGDQRWLLDAFEVSRAPSASVFAALSSRRARRTDLNALIVVDARYESREPPSGGRAPGTSLSRLAHTFQEGTSIAQFLLHEAVEDAAASLRASLNERIVELSRISSRTDAQQDLELDWPCLRFACGTKASPALFTSRAAGQVTDLTQYAILHIGAHGSFDLSDPDRACIELAPGDSSTGRLSRAEIANRLRTDAALVFLAVCDSALGLSAQGEGVLSIAEAFLLSGAGSVIAANWPLLDDKAAEIVQHFYRQYLRGPARLSASAALRKAKVALVDDGKLRGDAAFGGDWEPRRQTGADPYYWASLVAIGAQ